MRRKGFITAIVIFILFCTIAVCHADRKEEVCKVLYDILSSECASGGGISSTYAMKTIDAAASYYDIDTFYKFCDRAGEGENLSYRDFKTRFCEKAWIFSPVTMEMVKEWKEWKDDRCGQSVKTRRGMVRIIKNSDGSYVLKVRGKVVENVMGYGEEGQKGICISKSFRVKDSYIHFLWVNDVRYSNLAVLIDRRDGLYLALPSEVTYTHLIADPVVSVISRFNLTPDKLEIAIPIRADRYDVVVFDGNNLICKHFDNKAKKWETEKITLQRLL